MYLLTGQSQGLQNDAIVLQRNFALLDLQSVIIRPEFESCNPLKKHPLVGKRLIHLLSRRKRYANIHLERIHAAWTPLADLNIWIPNQEQLLSSTMQSIPLMDYVFCKTKEAQEIFANYHPNCIFTSFSSIDRYDASLKKDYRRFLHLMGASKFKGSRTLLNIWLRHPEWPALRVVCTARPWNNLEWIEAFDAGNIQIDHGPLSEQELMRLQNTCGIHLCPSETEGFGHYIVEALSTKAVVVTTNAQPMNEHVDRTHGFLADFSETAQFGLGIRYFVDENSLEAQIQAIIEAPLRKLEQMGCLAREKYLKIDSEFIRNLHNQCHLIKANT